MTTELFTGSAKIYQFPVRPRVNASQTRPAEIASPSICAEAFGSWYHQEAIQQASYNKPVREH